MQNKLLPFPPTLPPLGQTGLSWHNAESEKRVLGTSSLPTETAGPGQNKHRWRTVLIDEADLWFTANTVDMSGELPESKQTQNLGSSPVNLQLSPNFDHICGWSLRRATAMLHTQGRNALNHFTSMDMLKRSYFIISATKVGSKRLQQMWWRHLQKANSVCNTNWTNVVGDCSCYSRQTDTASQPEHKGITVWTSAWAGPKQITGGETLALTGSSYKTNKWMPTSLTLD